MADGCWYEQDVIDTWMDLRLDQTIRDIPYADILQLKNDVSIARINAEKANQGYVKDNEKLKAEIERLRVVENNLIQQNKEDFAEIERLKAELETQIYIGDSSFQKGLSKL